MGVFSGVFEGGLLEDTFLLPLFYGYYLFDWSEAHARADLPVSVNPDDCL